MITLILECMLLGIVAALTGIFYNYTLYYGEILERWGSLLDRWVNFEEYAHYNQVKCNSTAVNRFKAWIANPLGACIYCSTTWITIFIMVLYWSSWDNPPKWEDIIIGTLAAIGIQHVLLRLWCYTINHVEEE